MALKSTVPKRQGPGEQSSGGRSQDGLSPLPSQISFNFVCDGIRKDRSDPCCTYVYGCFYCVYWALTLFSSPQSTGAEMAASLGGNEAVLWVHGDLAGFA